MTDDDDGDDVTSVTPHSSAFDSDPESVPRSDLCLCVCRARALLASPLFACKKKEKSEKHATMDHGHVNECPGCVGACD